MPVGEPIGPAGGEGDRRLQKASYVVWEPLVEDISKGEMSLGIKGNLSCEYTGGLETGRERVTTGTQA